jgi:hypothetical protein
MKGFRRLTITALLLAGMAGAAFCETDYFLVVEQKPGGGFAQAAAMAIVPLLDDADTVSIVGVSNVVTLLLPPMPLGTPGLLAIVNGVLLKPVPQAPGKTPPYSPAIAAAINLAGEQAGALALAQPGRNARLVILAETTLKADGVSSPFNFARIDYISLNAAAGPEFAAFAGPDGVWELAEQPDPDAALPARPFAEGFLEFAKTINGNYTAAKISDAGDSFTLGDWVHVVHNAAVITAGAGAAVSKKGSSLGEEAYQYGNYAAAAPGAGGEYTAAGGQVIFAAELKALSPVFFMVIGITVAAVILIIVIACIVIRNRTRNQRKPYFKIELFDLTYGVPEKYAGSLTCAIGKKKNPEPDDDYTEQLVDGATLWDICKAFQIPEGEDALAYMLYKEGEEGQELIFAKQSKVFYDKKAGVWKISYPAGSDPDAVDNTGNPYPTEETIAETSGETFYTKGHVFYNYERIIVLGFTKL